MNINVVSTVLLAQVYKNFIKDANNPVFAALSAKVGSIEDNRMGGWYSYRISKAALNMTLKNIAIEYSRLNKKSCVCALHPGTTDTKLSEPFMRTAQKKYKIHSPSETAQHMINVIEKGQQARETGVFYSWDGQKLPWWIDIIHIAENSDFYWKLIEREAFDI